MNRILFLLLVFGGLHTSAFAQTKKLNLDEALKSLEANANTIKLIDKDIAMAKEQLEASKQYYLPQVSLQYSGVFTNSPLNSFGFKLNQEIVQQADFAPDLLNNPDVISNFNTKVQVMQPIFNYDAVLAKDMMQYQVEALELQQKHATNHLSLKLKNAYAQLQSLYAAQAVLAESKKALEAHLAIVENFVEQGLGKTSDRLAVQVQLKAIDNQQASITKHVSDLSAFIAYLIGDETGQVYEPDTSVDFATKSELVFTDSISNNRADLMAYQKAISAQEIGLKMTKAQNLPRLNGFGEFNLNDESPVGFGANNFMVGFSLSWRLNLGKQLNAKVNSQQLGLEKATLALEDAKAQSNMQLRQATSQYQMIKTQLENAESSLALAEERLRIVQNRFKEGLEKPADALVVENQVSQAKLMLKQLAAQLKQSQNQIEFLLSENK